MDHVKHSAVQFPPSFQCEYVIGQLFPDGWPLNPVPQNDHQRPNHEGSQHLQLLPWPANSSDMSPIEQEGDLVVRCLVDDPCPAASKVELLLRIQALWNSFPEADIQNLFASTLR
ncbi:transposable element Tcb1 transposase [Trichonephila clavipes]|nr:transposable element Tcb1 transposase [Trichonephila clavipes]